MKVAQYQLFYFTKKTIYSMKYYLYVVNTWKEI